MQTGVCTTKVKADASLHNEGRPSWCKHEPNGRRACKEGRLLPLGCQRSNRAARLAHDGCARPASTHSAHATHSVRSTPCLHSSLLFPLGLPGEGKAKGGQEGVTPHSLQDRLLRCPTKSLMSVSAGGHLLDALSGVKVNESVGR